MPPIKPWRELPSLREYRLRNRPYNVFKSYNLPNRRVGPDSGAEINITKNQTKKNRNAYWNINEYFELHNESFGIDAQKTCTYKPDITLGSLQRILRNEPSASPIALPRAYLNGTRINRITNKRISN